MRPPELFRRLRAGLARPGEPLPEEVRAWLLVGCEKYDGQKALDVLLGLRGAGVRTLGTIQKLEQRNVFLWIARTQHSHGGDPLATPETCDQNFVAAVTLFRRKWPRLQYHDAPPENLSNLDKMLFHAFRQGEPPHNQRVLLAAAELPSIHVQNTGRKCEA